MTAVLLSHWIYSAALLISELITLRIHLFTMIISPLGLLVYRIGKETEIVLHKSDVEEEPRGEAVNTVFYF